MRRFTILGLMGLVLGLAIAIAALRNADDHWAGGLLLATALLIGVAALAPSIIPADGVPDGWASRSSAGDTSPWRSWGCPSRT